MCSDFLSVILSDIAGFFDVCLQQIALFGFTVPEFQQFFAVKKTHIIKNDIFRDFMVRGF